jgi:SAM-dependent methyltransferase
MAEVEALPPEIPPVDGLRRWKDIVERRRVQMDAAYARAGIDSADYWGRRAQAYRAALHERTDEDPFLVRVKSALDADTTVIDVGAGTGRHTIALAPLVKRVTAVEPSDAMLGLLRQDAEEQRLTNVETVASDWLSAAVAPADLVICSHVLYPIGDIAPFVRKLAEKAKGRVFIYTRVDAMPTDMGLWGAFYGVPLQLQPSHLDLLNALAELGIVPDVEIVEHRFTWTFASLDEAVVHVRNSLCLREDDDVATAKLRGLLEARLITWANGRLGPQIGSTRSAIISWAAPHSAIPSR